MKRLLSLVLCLFIVLLLLYIPTIHADTVETILNSDRVIVSLGDSYSSGEGIEVFFGQNKEASKKVEDPDWLAHRSKNAWSGMLNLKTPDSQTIEMSENRDRNWFFAAMSGAITQNILDEEEIKLPLTKETRKSKWYRLKDYHYQGYEGTGVFNSQLEIFDEVKKLGKQTDYVTLTLGGNDAGFADVIKNL